MLCLDETEIPKYQIKLSLMRSVDFPFARKKHEKYYGYDRRYTSIYKSVRIIFKNWNDEQNNTSGGCTKSFNINLATITGRK